MQRTSNPFRTPIVPATLVSNAPESILYRDGGYRVSKTLNLTVNVGSETLNTFLVTGSVRVLGLYGFVTVATTIVNCTAVYFSLYDGTNTVVLTLDGAVLSGAAVGSMFLRNAVAGTALAVALSTQNRLTDTSSLLPFILTAKNGANTYVRFHYTTTDAPIAATVQIYAEYNGLAGGLLTAV